MTFDWRSNRGAARRRWVLGFVMILVVASALPACKFFRGCTSTDIEARDVAVVGLERAKTDLVLEARLTKGGKPYVGVGVDFNLVRRSVGAKSIGGDETDANGVARFNLGRRIQVANLRQRDALESRSYIAEFDPLFQNLEDKGCTSSDEAKFSFRL